MRARQLILDEMMAEDLLKTANLSNEVARTAGSVLLTGALRTRQASRVTSGNKHCPHQGLKHVVSNSLDGNGTKQM